MIVYLTTAEFEMILVNYLHLFISELGGGVKVFDRRGGYPCFDNGKGDQFVFTEQTGMKYIN